MNKEIFDLYEFMGHRVLFTPARMHDLNEPVPSELNKYEIRHSDEGGIPCELAKTIIVNHYGTIFSYDPIELDSDGYVYFEDEIDFIDLQDSMTFDEYLSEMRNLEENTGITQKYKQSDLKMNM